MTTVQTIRRVRKEQVMRSNLVFRGFWMSKDDLNILKKKAKRHRKTVSQLIRDSVFEKEDA
jgi:hypothetical protein